MAGLVGAVALVAAGTAIAQLGSDDEPSSQPSHVASSPSPSATPTVQSSADACAAEIRTTEAVVTAAHTAAGHWREHVQARTDLLSGKNSEETTKAIWKRTRLAGPTDIATLKAAITAQAKAQGGCAKLPGACSQRRTALDRAASANEAAARDWENHLAAMAAHAAGAFDADHAQQMWVAAWTAAPKNLNAAAQADAALAAAPACRPS